MGPGVEISPTFAAWQAIILNKQGDDVEIDAKKVSSDFFRPLLSF